MNDDFNTPILISHLFDGVRIINSAKDAKIQLTQGDIDLLIATFEGFLFDVCGLKMEEATGNDQLSDDLMKFILDMRADAKAKKDFATSDLIRDRLAELKIQIKDSKEGTTWSVND
jgi:cysteinyl-tRNA synthetase